MMIYHENHLMVTLELYQPLHDSQKWDGQRMSTLLDAITGQFQRLETLLPGSFFIKFVVS